MRAGKNVRLAVYYEPRESAERAIVQAAALTGVTVKVRRATAGSAGRQILQVKSAVRGALWHSLSPKRLW